MLRIASHETGLRGKRLGRDAHELDSAGLEPIMELVDADALVPLASLDTIVLTFVPKADEFWFFGSDLCCVEMRAEEEEPDG